MAVKALFVDESEAEGTWVLWRRDQETGEEASFLIRPVPASFDHALSRQINRGLRNDKMGKQPVAESIARVREFTLARAVYALRDSRNFAAGIGGDDVRDRLAELLGAKDLQVGGEVVTDGKWTDDLREYLLGLSPRLAAWVSNEADKLLRQEAQEDDELGKT